MESVAASLRLLADPTRLRILRVLARDELNVGELRDVLGIGQSSVSAHLAQLREAGLLRERRRGRYVFVSLGRMLGADAVGSAVLDAVEATEDEAGDLTRLADVLRRREETAFRSRSGSFVPARSWRAWSRALSLLVAPGLDVVDVGCGDGALTREVTRFARSVLAVDPREDRLRLARRDTPDDAPVRFARSELTRLPAEDASFDVALLSHVLHRVEEPAALVREALRVLRPGGRLLVLELDRHEQAWVRERLGHTRQGFTTDELAGVLEGATEVRVERMPTPADDPFRVLVATALRPGNSAP